MLIEGLSWGLAVVLAAVIVGAVALKRGARRPGKRAVAQAPGRRPRSSRGPRGG